MTDWFQNSTNECLQSGQLYHDFLHCPVLPTRYLPRGTGLQRRYIAHPRWRFIVKFLFWNSILKWKRITFALIFCFIFLNWEPSWWIHHESIEICISIKMFYIYVLYDWYRYIYFSSQKFKFSIKEYEGRFRCHFASCVNFRAFLQQCSEPRKPLSNVKRYSSYVSQYR